MEFVLMLPNRKAKYYWIDFGLSACAVVLLILGKWIPAILMLLMALMGFLIRKKPYLHISEKGIKIRMVWNNFHSWNKLNSCMLKDGMLTLDFKSNKLFQEVVDQTSATAINEDAFNEFCKAKISYVSGR